MTTTLLARLLVGAAFLSGATGLGLSAFTWQRRDGTAAKPFLVFALSQSAWSAATAFLWLSPAFRVAVGLGVLAHVFALGSLLSWVLFVVTYTGQSDRFAGWPRRLFFGWAGVFLVLRVTNPWTELLLADLEPASFQGLSLVAWTPTTFFAFNLVVIYGAILWTYWLLVRYARAAIGGQGRQALLILGAHLIFVGVNFLYYVGGYSVHPALDPSPIFFTATLVLVAVALFYYDFLDFGPLAADLMLKKMDDPVIVRDVQGGVLALNTPASKLVPEDTTTLADASPALASAVESDADTVTLEDEASPVQSPDTTDERVFDLSVSPIYTQGDRKRGELIVLRDVTILKQRETELQRQNERLDAFAGVVSHDLRNPLQVADGYLALAKDECDSPHLDDLDDALARMDTLIDDLLRLARAGRDIDDVTTVNLPTLVEECGRSVGTDEATIRTETDLKVLADRNRLQQLLGNLFRNAFEHGSTDSDPDSGSGTTHDDRVTVTVGSLEDGSGFYVADDGPGIPEEERKDIFESGYSTTAEGTGFGLAIVRDIVEAHGWKIRVTDSSAGGARFEITGLEVAA